MNKRIFKTIIFLLMLIIAAEGISLALLKHPEKQAEPESFAGAISAGEMLITVNDTEIPAYIFNEVPYAAAEDLLPFGISVINTTDGNMTIAKVENPNITEDFRFSEIPDGTKLAFINYSVSARGRAVQCYEAEKYHIIPSKTIAVFGEQTDETHFIIDAPELGFVMPTSAPLKNSKTVIDIDRDGSSASNTVIPGNGIPAKRQTASSAGTQPAPAQPAAENSKGIIVLDPGHGKSSSAMSKEEKENSGWVYNSEKKQWGEWRHWKTGTLWQDCEGSGCSGRAPANGSCWYPIGNGDRSTEPQVNLQNCLSAQKYLEEMGYTVRLTRTSNEENPSITRRLTYCYPDNNTSATPDADAFICIHSNAGGGRGSAYISLEGPYDQSGISPHYAEEGNKLGKAINDAIVSGTSLSISGSGSIDFEPELIAFCKAPVTCGYLEIGFFDNASDLNVLNSEYDQIGHAIASGIDSYMSAR